MKSNENDQRQEKSRDSAAKFMTKAIINATAKTDESTGKKLEA